MLHRAEDKVNRILREVIQEIDLEDEILRLGLCMDVGERGGRLSGGQSQKASLVRVLLKRPEILILDEATSALDNTSQRRVQDLVRQRFRGRTVVEVAHRLDAIRDADRIIVLKAGAITEEGTFPDLLAARGLFHELWTSAGGRAEESKTC
jgi:ABC-type multidrug transport system fused ATPase/permease subunit